MPLNWVLGDHTLVSNNQETEPTPDARPNKDWLQVWYTNCHSNIQWAKGQSWNAVQWSILLLAAIFAASKTYTAIPVCIWIAFTVVLAGVSAWWFIDLHQFAQRERNTALNLVKPLEELEQYIPKRRGDPHHLGLLVVKIIVTISAAIVTIVQMIIG